MSIKAAPESVTTNLALNEFIHGFYTGIKIEPDDGVIELMDASVVGDTETVVRDIPNNVTFVQIAISNSEIVLGNVMIVESAAESIAEALTEMIRGSALTGLKLNIKCSRVFLSQQKEELFRANQDYQIDGAWLRFAIFKIAIPKEYTRNPGDKVVLRDDGSVLAFERSGKGNFIH